MGGLFSTATVKTVVASRDHEDDFVFVGFLVPATAVAEQHDEPRPKGVIYGIAIGQDGQPAKGIILSACTLGVGRLLIPCDVICIAQTSFAPRSILGSIGRNQDYLSMNFEQWEQLSALASKEQDPAKLTDLARELNVVLNQKTQTLDSLPCKPSE
jgi:hypothetical protein